MAGYRSRQARSRAAFIAKGGGGILPPNGFYSNGAANTALKAMIAAVKAGTARGRIVLKGDSTVTGQGGGSADGALGLTAARMARPSVAMAAGLTAAGIRTLDVAMYGDNMGGAAVLSDYDPRISRGSPAWAPSPNQNFAGGALISSSGAGVFSLTEAGDSCKIVFYNSTAATVTLTVDGAPPVSGPSSVTLAATGGFTEVTIGASTPGVHVWGVSRTAGSPPIRSMLPYDSMVPAIDVLCHSVCGASSGTQVVNNTATSPGAWFNADALAYDSPQLTIINLGLNDMNQGVVLSNYSFNINSLITQGKAKGDVLLIFPYPAGGNFNQNVASYHDAAKAAAASKGVAFFSLFEFYGQAFTPALQARMFDGVVHAKAELYADVGAAEARAILAMVA